MEYGKILKQSAAEVRLPLAICKPHLRPASFVLCPRSLSYRLAIWLGAVLFSRPRPLQFAEFANKLLYARQTFGRIKKQ